MMLARLAENLFWAGRYLERAEHGARVCDVSHTALLESAPYEREEVMRALLAMLAAEDAFDAAGHPLTTSEVLHHLVADRENGSCVANAVAALRENVRSVREMVSQELWEATNNLYLDLQARDLRAELDDRPYELLSRVRERCQFITGVVHETLPRDEGWRFITLGQALERAMSTARTVMVSHDRLTAGTGTDFHVWTATLRSASALEAYRRNHKASLDPTDVVEFLVFDESFPRSTLFCLREVERNLRRLSGSADNPLCRRIGRLRSAVEYLDVDELVAAGVDEVLTDVVQGCTDVAALMGPQFFHHAEGQLHTVGAA